MKQIKASEIGDLIIKARKVAHSVNRTKQHAMAHKYLNMVKSALISHGNMVGGVYAMEVDGLIKVISKQKNKPRLKYLNGKWQECITFPPYSNRNISLRSAIEQSFTTPKVKLV